MSARQTPGERRGLDGVRGREFARVVWRRGLIILGLSGLAVTQPVLDLFGNNAEFFVAGSYTRGQIVAFALVVAFGPALIGLGLIALGAFVDRRVGAALFGAVCGVLAAALGLAVLRVIGVDSLLPVVLLAAGLAAGTVTLILRFGAMRLFVSYLAVANLFFAGSFLIVSPASALIVGDGSAGASSGSVTVPQLHGPIVLIILDELPAATIMRGDGTINDERYPGFAKLASVSTWFRNASGRSQWTPGALPALLTGTVPPSGALPIAAEFPRSLYTLLGGAVPVHNYEPITSLCPTSVCASAAASPVRQALTDASIVYGHRILPSSLRDGLPPIDNSWGAYGADDGTAASEEVVEPDDVEPTGDALFGRWNARGEDERSPRGQARVLAERIGAVTAEPALHVIHVVLPHFPWTLSASGMTTSYTQARRPSDLDADSPGFAFRARVEFQLHSMQVGAVDAVVGEAVDHLRSLPTWEATTLVVASDHGISLTPPTLDRRRVTEQNRAEVFRVPLFIKAPGQTEGEIRDDVAQTIDVVPSLLDLLGVSIDESWDFDGRSLYDGGAPTSEPRVSPDVGEVLAIAERRAAEFPHGDGWLGLAAVGDHGDLVGRDVAEFEVGGPSEYEATLLDEALFGDLPTDQGTMPFLLVGTVAGDGEPPELLVTINGRIAGVVGGYQPSGSGWEFVGYVADLYRRGANAVTLYEVERTGETVVLHEAHRPAA